MSDEGSTHQNLRSSDVSPHEDAMLAGAEGYEMLMDETGFLQPTFETDFYREPTDNVMRGVSLPSDLGAFLDFGCLPGPCEPITRDVTGYAGLDTLDNPFDKPRDEITRGVVLPPDIPAEATAFLPDGELMANTSGPRKLTNLLSVDFSETHEPPIKPTSSHWKYQVTHFLLDTEQPFKIGNTLLSFFSGSVVSDIKKVNHSKFSINAEVFVDSVACTLKVRVYAEPAGHRYGVEFQRRSGDCITFNLVYQGAARFLQTKFGLPDAEIVEQLCLVPPSVGIQSKDEVGPLLAMFAIPELQAESAAALARMAQHRSVASLLCTPDACKEYLQLLKSESTAVTYATACLLSRLVVCPEASEFFGHHGFTQLMREKAQAKSTPDLVQGKLEQALHSLVC